MTDTKFKTKEEYAAGKEHVNPVATNETLDTKLEAFESAKTEFKYEADKIAYEWEQENPMAVPKDILTKYPGFAFRFRAIDPATGHLQKGDSYHGWQIFKDGKLGYGDGLRYGGDTILCAMPVERAESYRKHVATQSTDRVKGVQTQHLENRERLAREMESAGVEVYSNPGNVSIGARRFPANPEDAKRGILTEQYRGYQPEELREQQVKMREDRQRRKSYSYPGQTKRG